MPTITLGFVNVGAAGGWQNVSGALVDGGAEATLPANAANGWLIAAALTSAVPAGSVTSITARAIAADGPEDPIDLDPQNPGANARTIEIAVTVDGWSPIAPPTKIAFQRGVPLTTTVAGVSRAQASSPLFGVMVRRGSGSNEHLGSARYVDRIEVEIAYTVPGVPGTAMSETRATGLQRYVVGLQTSGDDTTTLPTTLMKSSHIELRPNPTYADIEHASSLLPGDRVLEYEDSVGEIASGGRLDYNELRVYFTSLYGVPVVTTPSSGVERCEWNIDPRMYVKPGILVQHTGDVNVSEEHRHVVVNSFTMGGNKKSTTMGGSVLARKQTDQGTKPGGSRNAVHRLAFTGSPTGGGVTISYKGSMATIPATADAAAIQTLLTGMSEIGANNVVVTGTGPFTVTAANEKAGIEMAAFIVEAKALTGGTSPDFTASITTQGGWREMEGAPFTGLQATVYLSDSYLTLGTDATKIGELYEYSLEAANRYETADVVGRTDGTFKKLVPQPWKWTGTLGVQADVDAQAKAALARMNGFDAARYLRYEWLSEQVIKTGYKYSLTIDLFGKLKDTGEVKAFGNVRGRTFMFETLNDTKVWGRSGRIVLVGASGTLA